MNRDPLVRSTVTQGSIVIIPAYPCLFLSAGLLLLVQAPTRTSGEVFLVAADLMSIRTWGVLFVAVGVVEVFGLAFANRRVVIGGLIVGAGVSAFWGLLLIMGAVDNQFASFTSGLWVMFVALAHIASTRSLSRDIVKPPGASL